MKKTKQPVFNIGIIGMTLILAVITLVFILTVRSQYQEASINRIGSPVVVNNANSIKSKSDLDQALTDLDNADPGTFTQDLNAINSDASAF